jgi:hypothetical protein
VDRIAALRFASGCLWQAISLRSIHRISGLLLGDDLEIIRGRMGGFCFGCDGGWCFCDRETLGC